jgi:transcriptional antiterminator RfaH
MVDLWRETNWYAVHTKPFAEELAAFNVGRLGLQVFFPKLERQKLLLGVPRKTIKPLFPGYFFARFTPCHYLHVIHYARGVRSVVGPGDTPWPVDEEIIYAIQSRQGNEGYVHLERVALRAGDRVIITQKGSLHGVSGVFERELDDQQRVTILLEAIHYRARMIIEARHVQAATVSVNHV